MRPNEPCPDAGRLLALHRGELSPEDLEAVCDHLSACPGCECRLDALEKTDKVISNLRRFAGGPRVDPAEYEGLERRARAIPLGAPGDAGGPEPPTVADRPLRPGRLGRYELKEELGRGGMGVVYRAYHRRLDREFAVKVVRPEYADNPLVAARFLREALALGGLAHPNIVAATDADEAEGRHFLVMELVEGFDLETLVKRAGPLPVAAACEVIRQAAVGLQAVHDKGRVHRDLKPSNLMLSAHGVVKILDLGLAGLLDDAPRGTLTGSRHLMGTVDYMAPEQWADSHNVDIRADVYSLGCALYKLLTGSVPFGGPEYARPARKEFAHAEAPRPSARASRAEVPPELDAVVQRMMARDPADRCQTPKAVADVLAPFAAAADLPGLAAAGAAQGSPPPGGSAALSTATGARRAHPPPGPRGPLLPVPGRAAGDGPLRGRGRRRALTHPGTPWGRLPQGRRIEAEDGATLLPGDPGLVRLPGAVPGGGGPGPRRRHPPRGGLLARAVPLLPAG
jgi:eukaryotic-like serine/threonine-protein kinase